MIVDVANPNQIRMLGGLIAVAVPFPADADAGDINSFVGRFGSQFIGDRLPPATQNPTLPAAVYLRKSRRLVLFCRMRMRSVRPLRVNDWRVSEFDGRISIGVENNLHRFISRRKPARCWAAPDHENLSQSLCVVADRRCTNGADSE